MIHFKKRFSLTLAVILSVAAASSLRIDDKDDHNRSRSLEDDLTRYVIEYTAADFASMYDCRDSLIKSLSSLEIPDSTSMDDCMKSMMNITSSMEVKHMLKMGNAVAVMMNVDDFDRMTEEGYKIELDPERSTSTVESSRALQSQRFPDGMDMVRARETWAEFGVKGQGIKVCVVDSGLFSAHSDLTSSKISGYNGREAVTPWNEDTDGHGTHVTGIIAAADNNGGVVGVAPDVEIYVVRVFGNNGRFFGSDVTAASELCKDAGARIINMSLGGTRSLSSEKNTFNLLSEEGIITIAAAGNEGNSEFSYPASYPAVISVAAVDSKRNVASFSQRNSGVDVAGPGVNIRSLGTDDGLKLLSGTSQAVPHVAGVVALMMSYNSSIPSDSIMTALLDTANHPENQDVRTDGFGHGIVDAFDALTFLSTTFTPLGPRVFESAATHIWPKSAPLLVIVSVITAFIL